MSTFPALKDAEGRLAAKQDELGKIFDEAGPDLDLNKVKSIDGDTKAKAEAIRALNEECADLAKQAEGLRDVLKARESQRGREASEQHGDGARHETTKGAGDFGDMFTKSAAFTRKGAEATVEISLKALFDSAGAGGVESTRTGKVVENAVTPLDVLDLIPQTTTSQAAVTYMEETTFTNNAAEVAEGGLYPESALGLTEQTSSVRKVATWLPVTDELFEDVPRAREYVNNRLPFMVRQRLNGQILTGNGTAPNLRGLLNVAGIQTQAAGTDPVPDAVYKAMTKVRTVGQAIPNAAVFNPNDWQAVRLLRTADGIYIWGSPSEAGPERIWGLRVVQAQSLTENTGVVGDFANFSELAVRRGIDVQVSNSHADFFVNGKQAVRADVRAALIFYRPTAFCTVTGI